MWGVDQETQSEHAPPRPSAVLKFEFSFVDPHLQLRLQCHEEIESTHCLRLVLGRCSLEKPKSWMSYCFSVARCEASNCRHSHQGYRQELQAALVGVIFQHDAQSRGSALLPNFPWSHAESFSHSCRVPQVG